MTKTYMVDGQDRYVIDYRPQSDGTIKMFALDHPYNPQSDPVNVHHLYSSGEICVAAGHEPRTLDRATAIAATWMQGFSRYVRTGTFPSGTKRFNV